MSVTIQLPAMLRAYAAGPPEVVLEAATVRGALEALERMHPAVHRSICDETGAVRRHIHLFVNTSLVRGPEGLDRALAPGDVLVVLTAVSGG